jgi:hypothetical protein
VKGFTRLCCEARAAQKCMEDTGTVRAYVRFLAAKRRICVWASEYWNQKLWGEQVMYYDGAINAARKCERLTKGKV